MSSFIIVGWPRSGTTWLSRLIVHYLDGPGIRLWVEARDGLHPRSFRVHRMDDEEIAGRIANGDKIIFTTRDPRDTAASEYFFLHNRAYSVVDTTLYNYLKSVFVTERGGWRAYTEKWLRLVAENNNIITTSHEALWADRSGELQGILRRLGIEPEVATVRYATNASWKFGSTRPAYTRTQNWRDKKPSVLSGRPGEWKRHFTPGATIFLEKYCGDLARRLGYKSV